MPTKLPAYRAGLPLPILLRVAVVRLGGGPAAAVRLQASAAGAAAAATVSGGLLHLHGANGCGWSGPGVRQPFQRWAATEVEAPGPHKRLLPLQACPLSSTHSAVSQHAGGGVGGRVRVVVPRSGHLLAPVRAHQRQEERSWSLHGRGSVAANTPRTPSMRLPGGDAARSWPSTRS